jgi:hypothetical protein
MEYLLIVVLLGALAALYQHLKKVTLDRNSAVQELNEAVEALGPVHEASERLRKLERELTQHESRLRDAKLEYSELQKELSPLREASDEVAAGFYRPSYEFPDSEAYKAAIQKLQDQQKEMAKRGLAVSVAEWTVDNSKKAGAKMTKDVGMMMLRAFNGECDATIAKVSYKNFGPSKVRIEKAFSALNKLGAVLKAGISDDYLSLRLRELQLVFEYLEIKYEEEQEQRAIRERMREEERAARELQRALEDAQADEAKWTRALKTAQDKLTAAVGEEKSVLAARVAALEEQLAAALKEKQRAISMAEKTRAGYVYVISNIGSFGEGVFKVGLTRRLEPLDRVRELGDASVPFEFDVHALIYSEDAPALENALHKELAAFQVNRVNDRKEFFRVDLDTIESAVNKHHGRFRLTRLAEAKEFRESQALSAKNAEAREVPSKTTSFQPTAFARKNTTSSTRKQAA